MLDGAVAIFDAVAGVEPQTETVWRQADKYNVPRICFVNKMDRTGANFERTVEMIRDRLDAIPAVTQLPLGAEANFRGVVDVIAMKALVWDEASIGEKWSEEEIPADLRQAAEDARHDLVDLTSHYDDTVMEKYVVRRGDHRRRPPAGAARRHDIGAPRPRAVRLGVQEQRRPAAPRRGRRLPAEPRRPSADDRALAPWRRGPRAQGGRSEPFAALAFKIQTDPFVGKLTYLRVYSGTLEKGSTILNSTKDKRERIGRVLEMHANHREDKDAIFAGDIVAVVGLKTTTTGDTLCDPSHRSSSNRSSSQSRSSTSPSSRSRRPTRTSSGKALFALSEEDPTFRVRTDEETGQTVISGMGELHLEVLVDRMLREFKVDAHVGKPQVAYRETIRDAVRKVEERYIRQTGGRGQYGHVVIDLEPTGPGVATSSSTRSPAA